MSSTAIPSEAISFARNVTAFKGITVACATCYFYYNITHFSEEMEYIWARKWTSGKVLYLLTRCFASIFLVCSVIGVSNYAWHDHRYAFRRNTSNAHNFLKTCLHGGLYSGLGPMIILIAEIILQVRVYALYGRNRKALVSFVSLTLVLFGVNVLQLTNLFLGIEGGSCQDGRCKPDKFAYSDGPFACMTAQPMSGIGWEATASVELILFILVARVARIGSGLRLFRRSRKRDSSNGDILTTAMARESIVYFVVIFTVCFIAVVLVFIFEHVHIDGESVLFQMNAYETVVITVMAILAPKLIIDLRAECYHLSPTGTTQLSWNADVHQHSASDREGSNSSDM